MFEAMGATFGATLAGCLALVGAAGAAVYFFMRRKHDAQLHEQKEERRPISFEQMQTIIIGEIKNVRELVTVRSTRWCPLMTTKKFLASVCTCPAATENF